MRLQEIIDFKELPRKLSYVCPHPTCGMEIIFDLDKPIRQRTTCPFCNSEFQTDPGNLGQIPFLFEAMMAYKKFRDLAERLPVKLLRDYVKPEEVTEGGNYGTDKKGA